MAIVTYFVTCSPSIAAQQISPKESPSYDQVPPRAINIKQHPYNAVGDGRSDDTAAIQAAIHTAEASGGRIFLPAGSYRTTENIVINASDITIEGTDETRIAVDHADPYAMVVAGTPRNWITNVTIKDITFQSVGTNLQRALNLLYINGAEIERVRVPEAQKHGMQWRAVRNIIGRNITIGNTGQDGSGFGHGIGIYPKGDDYSIVSRNIQLEELTFTNVFGNSLDLTGVRNAVIDQCRFYNGTTDDSAVVAFEGCTDSVIQNSYFETTPGSGRHGILVRKFVDPNGVLPDTPSDHILIQNNVIIGMSGYDVNIIEGSKNSIVRSNRVECTTSNTCK